MPLHARYSVPMSHGLYMTRCLLQKPRICRPCRFWCMSTLLSQCFVLMIVLILILLVILLVKLALHVLVRYSNCNVPVCLHVQTHSNQSITLSLQYLCHTFPRPLLASI